ncbi:hypothetical protein HMPREF7215_2121 [Pyramidobacter piscolens W5455]|uniref:Uncharacterized protein n=1 Tax=Pyramidobacter piscolens W5455 TaxID=352165 RepID=A0ABM9ZUD0_9BACT|nr:hypothetical protein HMPREF7215_2121 [Pyramidobacter piscolens W5455]
MPARRFEPRFAYCNAERRQNQPFSSLPTPRGLAVFRQGMFHVEHFIRRSAPILTLEGFDGNAKTDGIRS